MRLQLSIGEIRLWWRYPSQNLTIASIALPEGATVGGAADRSKKDSPNHYVGRKVALRRCLKHPPFCANRQLRREVYDALRTRGVKGFGA